MTGLIRVIVRTNLHIPRQVRGPMQLDANGDAKPNRGKLSVRHFAKVSSEGFVGDKEAAEFSGYEHKVGLAPRGCDNRVRPDVGWPYQHVTQNGRSKRNMKRNI